MANDARHGAGRAAHAAGHARAAGAAAGRRRNPGRGRGLRRLPHRSARGRRRTRPSEAADRARATRSSAASQRSAQGVERLCRSASASACRGWARPAAPAPTAAAGAENLCDTPVFTGYTRDGGYATHAVADARLLLSARRGRRRRRDRALAVRRPDRLAQLSHGGRGQERSASTASAPPPISWRRSRSGRAGASSPSRAKATCAAQDFAALARRGLGGRLRRDAAGTARCRHHLRAGRRAGAGRAESGPQGRPRRLRRHPHVRHPELSLCAAVGGAARDVGRQPDARGRA